MAPLLCATEGLAASWSQKQTQVSSGVKRWFLSEECHLFPCLLHLSLGMSDGQILLLIALNSPQVSCFQHRTPCPGCSCPLFASLFFCEVPAGNFFEVM